MQTSSPAESSLSDARSLRNNSFGRNLSEAGCFQKQGLLLPFIPCEEEQWNPTLRACLYCAGLLYCSIGVTIVAGVFMSSIEKITSQTRKIHLSSPKTSIEIRVWNDTVANLTLMALGSSAPEILLSVVEIVKNGFEGGELGPGTIVGSAAFNLLAITAVCIVSIPDGEVRRIQMGKVFSVTATFCLCAYVWLIVVLDYSSPKEVEVWEALVTLSFFPLMVLIAWWADRGWTFGRGRKDAQEEIGLDEYGGAKLFSADGKISKEGLLQFYKGLRKFDGLSDSDAAVLAATKLVDSQRHSRMWYRIGAVRGLSGGRKIQPVLNKKLKMVYDTINASPDLPDLGNLGEQVDLGKALIEFEVASISVPENIGKVDVTVVRGGNLEGSLRVRIESFDGTAKQGEDYIPVNEIITFGPFEKSHVVEVLIVDDNQWEPDEEFFLRLSVLDDDGMGYGVLGRLSIMEILILDDDEPGFLSFVKRGYLVKESCAIAHIEVERVDGADGIVSVHYRTIDGTARHGLDFNGGKGILTFKDREKVQTIAIPVFDLSSGAEGQSRDVVLEVELYDPEGGAALGRIPKTAVTITSDESFASVLHRLTQLTEQNMKALEVQSTSYARQIKDALSVPEHATTLDYFMHFLTFGWKVIFALIPPSGWCGGWLCFAFSLVAIGIITTLVGDLASLFGCMVGLKDTVTAITFVSLGTSLPDLFASKVAAIQEKYADNAIGNVTGSNSVNVFLGLGLPWLLASVYHKLQGRAFTVSSETLDFSVLVYSAVAFLTIGLLFVRRTFPLFGRAELGGPRLWKWLSAILLFAFWFLYVLLCSSQAYGLIKFSLDG